MTNQFSRVNTTGREIDAGLRNHFNNVYALMTLGLLVTTLTAAVTSGSPMIQEFLGFMSSNMFLAMLVMFSPMILIMMVFNPVMMQRASVPVLAGTFLLFSAYFGVLFSTLFLIYTGESLARVFLITAGMFAGMSIYGYTTKANLSSIGSILGMGAFGLLIAMGANVFFQSTFMFFAISGVGVVLYTLLIAFNTQKIKESYNPAFGDNVNGKMAVMGALNLYIDFVMLFQFLLNFLGNRE